MDNEEVKYYKSRFARWIRSAKWDSIAEQMSDLHMTVIAKVMNAEKDGDCSWLVWKCCDDVLERIREIDKKLF